MNIKKIQAGAGENPPQEKVKAIQVEEETPSVQKDRKAKTILQVQEVADEKLNGTGTVKEKGVGEASK